MQFLKQKLKKKQPLRNKWLSDGLCYICHTWNSRSNHEAIGNTGRRQLSIKYGLQIAICDRCHKWLHSNPKENEVYQIEMQEKFENEHPELDFLKIFAKNYREET